MIQCEYVDGDPVWEGLKEQASRLENFDKFPWEKAALRDLVLALAGADSVAEATEVVDGFVKYHKGRCPNAANLREALNELQERRGKVPASESGTCPDCGGRGFHFRVALQWRVQLPDGSWRPRMRFVPDEENGLEEARAMRPEREAKVYEVTVDCKCQKKAITATETTETRK